jgi:hypothetical protein
MPPKRAVFGSSSRAKSSKANKAASPSTAGGAAPKPRSKDGRWSAVSASANVDAEYKMLTQNPVNAYTYICICPPRFDQDNDDDEDSEDEADDEDDECDGSDDGKNLKRGHGGCGSSKMSMPKARCGAS